LREAGEDLNSALDGYRPRLRWRETGVIEDVANGVVHVRGLPGVQAMELVRFNGGVLGIAFNLDPEQVGVVLLGSQNGLGAGSAAERVGRVVDVPVGPALLGRVIDGLGRALDGEVAPSGVARLPVERPAPMIRERAPVSQPLATGIKVVDAAVPIGRGQRELILGDRQTGKTALALDAIANQRGGDVVCVYCAIGQRGSAVARVIHSLRECNALEHTVVVVAAGEDPTGLQYLTPYAATSIAEWFMERGRDVLIVYDDLSKHAVAYRELSLLLRRPPGREAYPGDIFYIHSRMLERATRLRPERGGGSLTALPVVETEAGNLAAYIPTNLISITDGQIYLSPQLFRKGLLPAVELGRSVSRVGGKAQLPGYRAVAGELKLAYAQFEELETFARFGTRLDDTTRRTLERGRRVRALLVQSSFSPLTPGLQIGLLLAVTRGLFDDVALAQLADAERAVYAALRQGGVEICARVDAGATVDGALEAALLDLVGNALAPFRNAAND
jgi:F-type H+-transporting ATPase subunit alpha